MRICFPPKKYCAGFNSPNWSELAKWPYFIEKWMNLHEMIAVPSGCQIFGLVQTFLSHIWNKWNRIHFSILSHQPFWKRWVHSQNKGMTLSLHSLTGHFHFNMVPSTFKDTVGWGALLLLKSQSLWLGEMTFWSGCRHIQPTSLEGHSVISRGGRFEVGDVMPCFIYLQLFRMTWITGLWQKATSNGIRESVKTISQCSCKIFGSNILPTGDHSWQRRMARIQPWQGQCGIYSWSKFMSKSPSQGVQQVGTMEHVDMVLSCPIQVRWTSMIWGSAPSCSIGGKVMLIFGCVFFVFVWNHGPPPNFC